MKITVKLKSVLSARSMRKSVRDFLRKKFSNLGGTLNEVSLQLMRLPQNGHYEAHLTVAGPNSKQAIAVTHGSPMAAVQQAVSKFTSQSSLSASTT